MGLRIFLGIFYVNLMPNKKKCTCAPNCACALDISPLHKTHVNPAF